MINFDVCNNTGKEIYMLVSYPDQPSVSGPDWNICYWEPARVKRKCERGHEVVITETKNPCPFAIFTGTSSFLPELYETKQEVAEKLNWLKDVTQEHLMKYNDYEKFRDVEKIYREVLKSLWSHVEQGPESNDD